MDDDTNATQTPTDATDDVVADDTATTVPATEGATPEADETSTEESTTDEMPPKTEMPGGAETLPGGPVMTGNADTDDDAVDGAEKPSDDTEEPEEPKTDEEAA